MKVVADSTVQSHLKALTKEDILYEFQPALIQGLKAYAADHSIVPPRIVEPNRQSDTVHLFMPCVGPEQVGIKIISGGPTNTQTGLGFQGAVVVMDEKTGEIEGMVSANTLTAFRTALASTIGLVKVIDASSGRILPEITVFGVGRQAYWHVRLVLVLYGDRISKVNVANRSKENAEIFAATIRSEFSIHVSVFQLSDESLALSCHNSSIILGCLPATDSPIKKHFINQDPAYPTFISLIGSYKPHMHELDLDFISQVKNSTKIIVDSKDHALAEAGELIKTGVTSDGLVELTEDFEGVTTEGNVTIQKIVGLAVMDVAMAKLMVSWGTDVSF